MAKSATLASAFKKLRESRGIAQRQVAIACDYSDATPWKVENGRSVRWETIHTMLTVALRCQPGSPDYDNIHRLWLKFRETMAESAPPGKGRSKVSKTAKMATTAFRNLIRDRSDKDVRKIMVAAARAAAKLDGVVFVDQDALPYRKTGLEIDKKKSDKLVRVRDAGKKAARPSRRGGRGS